LRLFDFAIPMLRLSKTWYSGLTFFLSETMFGISTLTHALVDPKAAMSHASQLPRMLASFYVLVNVGAHSI
jgi:hypothetical protein